MGKSLDFTLNVIEHYQSCFKQENNMKDKTHTFKSITIAAM